MKEELMKQIQNKQANEEASKKNDRERHIEQLKAMEEKLAQDEVNRTHLKSKISKGLNPGE